MFGRPEGGTFADGVSRVAYSDADVAGRQYVMDLMRAAKLEPLIDPAGNIFATRAGSEPSLPPILFGSHIDSPAPTQRRRPRRADDGAARADGHDLRAEHSGDQPFAEGIDVMGGLRQRG
jgi:hypothetical protein